MFTLLRGLFKWLAEEDVIEVNPALSIRRPTTAESRDRVLDDEELRAIWDATYDEEVNPVMGAWIRFLLVTGQRRNEVAGMEWSELKDDGTTWTIPGKRTKNRKPTDVTLTPFALTSCRLRTGPRSSSSSPIAAKITSRASRKLKAKLARHRRAEGDVALPRLPPHGCDRLREAGRAPARD